MAYLFNSADDDSEATGKQNIFGGEQTQQGTTSGQAPDAIEKTQTSGAVSSGGGGGGGTQPKQTSSASASYNPKDTSASFQRAAMNIKIPSKISQAQGSLAQGSQTLQQKANEYGQKAQETTKGYQLGSDTLESAASGSKTDYEKVGQRLRESGPAQFEDFGGLGEAAPNVDYVKDTGRLFASEVGPSYTGGQGRFDAALLRRNPEFLRQQSQILADQRKLREADTKAQTDETAKAKTLLGSAFTDATADIKQRLGGMSSQVLSAAQKREAEEDAKRQALDASKISQSDLARLKHQINQDFRSEDPRSQQSRALKYLDQDFDVSPYVNIDRDVTWQEMLTQPDVDRYNRVEGLLGNSDLLTAGKGGGDAYTFNDRDAYRSIVDQIKSKRSAQDAKNQAEIARIQAASGQRAAEQNKMLEGSAEERARGELESYLQQKNDEFQGSSRGRDQYVSATRNALNDLFTAPEAQGMIQDLDPSMDWRSALSGEEAQQLTALSQDTGLVDQYQGGAGAGREYDIAQLKQLYDQLVQDRYSTYQGGV